jgi:hypothetical protein
MRLDRARVSGIELAVEQRVQRSGLSMMARRCSPRLTATLATPSIERSLPSATFIGPGDGAAPGAGCGNAVERAVWKTTLPSTFCIT